MRLEEMTPGMWVQHDNGFRGSVQDPTPAGFAIIWEHAGLVGYPPGQAAEFTPVPLKQP